jgi:DnaJ-class molecular chaperone
MSGRDFYNILGVSKHANADEIKTAFRRAAKRLHPDATGNDPKFDEQFKEAQEAYSVLSDVNQRARYDDIEQATKAIKTQQEAIDPKGADPWDITTAFGRKAPTRKRTHPSDLWTTAEALVMLARFTRWLNKNTKFIRNRTIRWSVGDVASILATLIFVFLIFVIIYYAQYAQ